MATVTAKPNTRDILPPAPLCGEPHPLFHNGTLVLKCDLPRGHIPANSHVVSLPWLDGRPESRKPGYR